ncbi:glycosyltransferase family 1 protein [Chryseobacterium indologenes]|uniref:Glycosyltransferase family 4 protein n=1 Tax=Chryseobacterium indologenes TaxID=253 RepID=A0A0N0ZT43_CHRID|nr:glycosyltransferase family 1 protein [Chryseobacterium indologenes]KPE49848.1 hypothetical protein AOB46_17965 [Chryseobacterium indologenes]
MKVLIISHNPFSKISNNGKTLESIFRNFRKEELSQIYFVEDKDIDEDYAGAYFKITDRDLLVKSKEKKISSVEVQDIMLSSKKGGDLRKYKHNLAIFRDYLWKFKNVKNNGKLHQWIQQQNPDFLFFVGANQVFSHDIMVEIAERYNLKSAVYFTDDYIFSTQKKNYLQKLQYKKLYKAYQRTINKADLCFGISHLMCQVYTEHYEKKFNPIMNSVNPKIYEGVEKNQKKAKDKMIVSYFGGLHLNRDKMIIRLAKIFSKIKQNKIEINVYTPSEIDNSLRNSFAENNIFIKNKVQGKELYQEIINTDILLHTESDDLFNRSLTKLSVSTKIPEYLLSQNLILAYGPTDIASIKLLQDNDLALIINSEESDEINVEKMIKVLNSNEQNRLIKNAYVYGVKEFDEERISTNFRKIVENEI